MATYAVGDVQGCYDQFMALLEHIAFDPQHDRLWLAGDVVNRGPQSLACLRFLRNLQPAPVMVLGNHDLHLLALAAGCRAYHADDTLDEILKASDCDDLLNWLRFQPMFHYDTTLKIALVHAGLAPQWDLALAQQCAQELEAVLRADNYVDFLKHMYGNEPHYWDANLQGWERLRFICNVFTRIRYCSVQGGLNLKDKGEIGSQADEYMPWFEAPENRHSDLTIVFGHWAALGAKIIHDRYIATDSGCIWGNRLSAIRLEDRQYFSVPGLQR